jgi:O-antigen ligase
MSPRERLTFGHTAFTAVAGRPSVIAAALTHEPQPVRLTHPETWDWGWGGLLLFSILLFFRPQDQFAGLGNSHLSDLAAIVGLSAMAFLNLSRREPIIRVNPELLGVFGLAAIMLLTVPTSFWPGGALATFRTMFVPVAFVFMLIVNRVTSPKRIERICWVIVLAFGYFSARVIFNYIRGVHLVEGNRAAGPVGGFFENPNDLSLNLASFLPIALMFVKRPGALLKRALCAGIALLMLVVVVLTKSRGGLLGTVAMLVTFLVVSRSLKPGTMIALVLAGMLALPVLPSAFWDRMSSITDAEKDPTGSREERKQLLQIGWENLSRSPADRRRRRAIPEPRGRRHQTMARNAQRAAAGRFRAGAVRRRPLRLPDRAQLHRGQLDAPPVVVDLSQARAQPRPSAGARRRSR